MCVGEGDLLGYTNFLSSSLVRNDFVHVIWNLQLIFITLAKTWFRRKKIPNSNSFIFIKYKDTFTFQKAIGSLGFFPF